MPEQSRATELRRRLDEIGDPRALKWTEAEPECNYVEELDLTATDAPALLEIIPEWLVEIGDEQQDEDTIYAPVHAWRAAGQLGLTQVLPLLLQMMEPMDLRDDDWYLEEFPDVFALLGPVAIEPLKAYLADPERLDFPRICAADGLRHIAGRHVSERERVVRILTDQIDQFAAQDRLLNGLLVAGLLELRAVEAEASLEKAFAADAIDVSSCGNWNSVCKELGIVGTGLVSPAIASQSEAVPWAGTLPLPRQPTAKRVSRQRSPLLPSDNPRPKGKKRKPKGGKGKRKGGRR